MPISGSEVVLNAVREDRGDRSTGENVVMTVEERVYTSREPKGELRLSLLSGRTIMGRNGCIK